MPSGDAISKTPSARTLGIATGMALLVASAILVTIVLPAEYGIDPLGTGRALGLDVMTAPIVDEAVPVDPESATMVPTVNGPIATYPAEFRVDSRQIVLEPYEYKEFKYRLEKSATMVFCLEGERRPRPRLSRRRRRRLGRDRAKLRQGAASSGERQLRGAVLRDSRVVLGEPRRRAGDDHADHRRLLHIGARVPHGPQTIPP